MVNKREQVIENWKEQKCSKVARYRSKTPESDLIKKSGEKENGGMYFRIEQK